MKTPVEWIAEFAGTANPNAPITLKPEYIRAIQTEALITALRHAESLCETRKGTFKTAGFNAACDELKIMMEAAISQVETGGDMAAYSYTQKGPNPTVPK